MGVSIPGGGGFLFRATVVHDINLYWGPNIQSVVIQIVDPCNNVNCHNGGKCIRLEHQNLICQCLAGFDGALCEIRLAGSDPCESLPCQNGASCTSPDGLSYSCQCPAGFTGLTCDVAVNPCDNSRCQNGGTCIPLDHRKVFCQCLVGFEGSFCENRIKTNPCDSNPCANGAACFIISGTNFLCNCTLGHTGSTCDAVLQISTERPVTSPGMSLEQTQMSSMSRPTEGAETETGLTELETPITNDKQPTGSTDSFKPDTKSTSSQQPETGGTSAESPETPSSRTSLISTSLSVVQTSTEGPETSPSMSLEQTQMSSMSRPEGAETEMGFAELETPTTNDKQPTGSTDSFKPNTKSTSRQEPKTGGTSAESPETPSSRSSLISTSLSAINPCNSQTCLNGGTCTRENSLMYTCECTVGFEGRHCEVTMDFCNPQPCLNGGTCNSIPRTWYYCTCAAGFQGTECQTQIQTDQNNIPVVAVIIPLCAVITFLATVLLLQSFIVPKQLRQSHLPPLPNRSDQPLHHVVELESITTETISEYEHRYNEIDDNVGYFTTVNSSVRLRSDEVEQEVCQVDISNDDGYLTPDVAPYYTSY